MKITTGKSVLKLVVNTKSHNFSKQRINQTDVMILYFEGELITEKDGAINKVGHGE